jgi:hypothetical protein
MIAKLLGRLSPEMRVGLLAGAASFFVAVARRKTVPLLSFDFLAWWFVNFFGVAVLAAITYAAIIGFSDFCLGYKHKETSTLEVTYYIYMTVLVAAVSLLVLSHVAPLDDYYE